MGREDLSGLDQEPLTTKDGIVADGRHVAVTEAADADVAAADLEPDPRHREPVVGLLTVILTLVGLLERADPSTPFAVALVGAVAVLGGLYVRGNVKPL